ncbi:hypothetical protein [Flavobacterium sp. 3HN19-14]|uniref:hypothetical protein n=1 Tax=Flavobacterium sp. 3HN19-14 TaxID=3448133 RepID=UPI003EE2D7DB
MTYLRSSCATFSEFSTINGTSTQNVTVMVDVDPCACVNEESVTESKNFDFNRTTAGTYVLNFKKADGTFLTHTIVVS